MRSTTMRLSPLDQIAPKVYSRLLFFFPQNQTPILPREQVVARLQYGLKQTINDIPILQGRLESGNRGEYEVKVNKAQVDEENLNFTVMDADAKADTSNNEGNQFELNYEDLKAKGFPMEHLDGEVLIPFGKDLSEGMIGAQVTFILGGIILGVAISHVIRDLPGFEVIMKTWASHCRALDLEDKDSSAAAVAYSIPPEAMDRETWCEGVESVPTREHPEYAILPEPATQKVASKGAENPTSPPPLPPCLVSTFFFSKNSLARLKQNVSAQIQNVESSSWIATNDALAALLWTCISQARLIGSEVSSATAANTSTLAMAVNGRSRLKPPLPATYIGNATVYALSDKPLKVLQQASSADAILGLGALAQDIRASLSCVDDDHMRSVISLVKSLDDVSRLAPSFNNFLGPDLLYTSWASIDLYDLDFGVSLGSRPERIRVPKTPCDGLCIAFPRDTNGGIEVAVCLKRDHMDNLKRMRTFTEWGSWRCD